MALDNLKNLATQSIAGGIQKALLVIHKEVDASQINSAQIAAAAEQALKGTAANLTATSEGLSGAGMNASVMQVQYNPSTLNFRANAQSISFQQLQQSNDSGVPLQVARPPMVMLSVELMFDAMNPKDAFMAEKFSLSTRGVVSSAAGAKMLGQGGYTVQPQTEGLVAALLQPDTRALTFRWADMAFTGHLVEIQADYTMFSPSGKPIRSKVMLNIAQQVESDADLQYWDQTFDRMFQDSSTVGNRKADQTMGNILNLDALKGFL